MKVIAQFVKHIPSLSLTLYTPEHNYLSFNNAKKDNPRLIVSGLTSMQKPEMLALMKDLVNQSHFPDNSTKHVAALSLEDVSRLKPWKENAIFYTSIGKLFNCRFRLDDNCVVDLWLDQEKMDLHTIKENAQRDFWIMHIYTKVLRDNGLTNEFVKAHLWTWTEKDSIKLNKSV